jgi:thermitase
MKTKSSFLLHLILLLVMAVSISSPAVAAAPAPGKSAVPLVRAGVVLVGFYPEALGADTGVGIQTVALASSGAAQALEHQLNLGRLSPLFNATVPQRPAALAALPAAQRRLALPDQPVAIYQLTLAAGTSVESALQALRANPAVAYAEPDYQAVAAQVPNDPRFASNDQWGLSKIQAPAAWDSVTGANETIIAVIDSGIKADHEDLAAQLWTNPNEIADNGVDDDHNGYIDDVHGANVLTKGGSLTDSTGHGTQVAGVIAAQTNNSLGVAGVCWNCRLMVVKVMGPTGTANYSDIAAGVNYAVKMGAKVINLSLGGYSDSATLKAAVQAAAQTAVVVAGAGNDNQSNLFYPAAYSDAVMAVAGTDANDVKHSASNYGPWITLAAPGENIMTTDFGGSYSSASGTSLAAPFVSGVAGLLISQNPGWSPALVRRQMVHTAEDIDGLNPSLAGKLGSGRLNAYQAVTTAPTPNFLLQDFTVGGKLGGSVKADGSEVALWLNLQNDWLGVPSASVVLTTTAPADVQIVKGSATLNASSDQTNLDNSADAFKVLVPVGKYGLNLPLHLEINAAGVTRSLDFSVQSEGAMVPVTGSIASDTTWLNTRTYHVTGPLTVSSGATLTIQPGTQILVDPNTALKKIFIKVDGKLIADGTANAPIVFTTSSASNAHWNGLTFTDLAAPAVFDANGAYLNGSILRYVHVSYAETGVLFQTKAPYFAYDLFESNTTGISQGSASSPRIENSVFSANGFDGAMVSTSYAIQLTGGSPMVVGNVFKGNSAKVTLRLRKGVLMAY